MEKSRQVQRAEYRREMKRGRTLAKRRTRDRRAKSNEGSGDMVASALRLAAMIAQSRLGRDKGKRRFA